MKLYFLRHGLAAAHDSRRYPDDNARPLTPEGKKKMRLIAKALAAMGISCDALITSPLPRAAQTAEIVADYLDTGAGIILAEELSPEGDPKRMIQRLNEEYAAAGSVMLVGHEPYLSQLISVLLTGGSALPIELKKGGVCRLEVESLRYGKCAILQCLLAPKQMIRK